MVDQLAVDTTVRTWLVNYTALTDVVGTKIYSEEAPPNQALPYVIFRLQGGSPVNDTQRDAAEIVVSVMAIAENASDATTIADLIKARMHKVTITSSDSNWHDFRSEMVGYVQYTNFVDSVMYWRRGGNFLLRSTEI